MENDYFSRYKALCGQGLILDKGSGQDWCVTTQGTHFGHLLFFIYSIETPIYA